MTGLDTNVLVRYLTQDDEAQLRLVLAMFQRPNALFFVSDLVLVETRWILRSLYDWTDDEVADAYQCLLTVHNLAFEDESRLRNAIRGMKKGADFPDELIVNCCHAHGCRAIATFDKDMAKRHPGFAVPPK